MMQTEGSSMTIFTEFKEKHGMDDSWTVRFTADELRAREMAQQYRDAGFDVRVLPLSPDDDELEIDAVALESYAETLEHDPLQYIEAEECASCLDDTFVVFTTDSSEDPDESSDLVFV